MVKFIAFYVLDLTILIKVIGLAPILRLNMVSYADMSEDYKSYA